MITQNAIRIRNIKKKNEKFNVFIKTYLDDIGLSIIVTFGIMIILCNDFGIFILENTSFFNINELVIKIIESGFKTELLYSMAAFIGLFDIMLVKLLISIGRLGKKYILDKLSIKYSKK